MPLILALEPDRSRASQLTAAVRPLTADFVLAASIEEALGALDNRIPDLILTPAFLSRRDDDALTDRLRLWGVAASHVQTLTIPILAKKTIQAPRGGVLRGLRRQKPSGSIPDGCDPEVFASQITEYLRRATEVREEDAAQVVDVLAVSPVESPLAALEPLPVVPESPFVFVEESPSEDEDTWRLTAGTALEKIAVPTPAEPAAAMAFVLLTPVYALPPEPIEFPVALVFEEESPSGIENTWMLTAGTAPVEVALPTPAEPPAAMEFVLLVPVYALLHEPAELPAAPVFEIVTVWDLDDVWPERYASSAAVVESLPHDPDVWVLTPISEPEATPVAAAKAPVFEMVTVVDLDFVPTVPAVMPPPPRDVVVASPPVTTRRRKAAVSKTRPIQDEWGFFDPGQCGFAVLLDKLDEVTSGDAAVGRMNDARVRVISY